MKKIVLCVLIAAALTGGAVFAQGIGFDSRPKPPDAAPAEKTTVSGKLEIAKGRIALRDGNTLYYVRGLNRLAGFVDGLKEGAQITVEGEVFNFPQGSDKLLHASKVTLAGKDYELDNSFGPNGPPDGPGRPDGPKVQIFDAERGRRPGQR